MDSGRFVLAVCGNADGIAAADVQPHDGHHARCADAGFVLLDFNAIAMLLTDFCKSSCGSTANAVVACDGILELFHDNPSSFQFLWFHYNQNKVGKIAA